jgi:hypothetical protein
MMQTKGFECRRPDTRYRAQLSEQIRLLPPSEAISLTFVTDRDPLHVGALVISWLGFTKIDRTYYRSLEYR